ncbi:protein-glutamate O-methyltransferase CheR [Paenibacillus nanensis]|uniref:protein-glutamate O-methyltransferase n=1 Tax=Paenibacillus nanensis TaxID=393251 RepID=A0A3A1V1L3_9BACL|nr:protein-glutamate O-methyltransferase CheR [Paenibacillus nanensis]RIX53686.1 protein-glutamate O-methyltransferase CheR [Paenibacillus nanensis]
MISITNNEFKQLTEFIHREYGIHLKEEKKALVTGRLYQVLAKLQMTSFKQYYEYIVKDPTGKAVQTLVDKITTNHTFFMREAEHFTFLKHQVLPFLASTVHDKDLRIWSAGCSSGEEPYTLAMILDDFFGREKPHWDTKVLATDISSQILEKASKGVYPNEDIAVLPANWRINYFQGYDKEHSIIQDQLKKEVIFRRFNLMNTAFPFKKKFHVIFCRNVMIYFDNETKHQLVERFYDHLMPGGYLFIGHSESIPRESTRFTYIRPAVYRKE